MESPRNNRNAESNEKKPKKFLALRAFMVYAIFAILAVVAIGKIIYVQATEKKALEEDALKNAYGVDEKEAYRGTIYARDGKVLLKRCTLFDIYMDTFPKDPHKPNQESLLDSAEFFSGVQELADSLHLLFPEKMASYYEKLLRDGRAKQRRFLSIKKGVNIQELERMKQFPIFSNRKKNNCFIALPQESYEKPYRDLAPRTLGYVREKIVKTEDGRDSIIMMNVGIEGAYDSILTSKKGRIVTQRIGKKTWAEIDHPDNIYPENGKDIITTLDVTIQDVAQKSLLENLKLHNAKSGCAVVMEVKTGEVLAITNLTKDKNGEYDEVYNYAIGTRTDPGSLFKTAALAVALQDGKITLTDTYPISQSEMFPGRGKAVSDSGKPKKSTPTVLEIFEKSSNVGTVKIIHTHYKDDQQKFIDGLYALGLNQPLGIELAGEAAPYIKNTKDKTWSRSTITSMPMGYEVEMTPLQILAFYNAIANDGVFIKPKFVREIQENGETVAVIKTDTLVAKIASEAVIADLQTMLRGVVLNGTAMKKFLGVPYAVAGKTGTAQVTVGSDGYSSRSHNASFCGYFPADNPKYSCIIVIYEPLDGKYYASDVAVPVFRDIANKLYAVDIELIPEANGFVPADSVRFIPMNINTMKENVQIIAEHIELALNVNDVNSDWVSVKTGKNELQIVPNRIEKGVIPNVTGMGLTDAIYILEEKGLTVETSGYGKVEKQSPSAGTVIGNTEKVVLTLKM